jgi:hypothetical protein
MNGVEMIVDVPRREPGVDLSGRRGIHVCRSAEFPQNSRDRYAALCAAHLRRFVMPRRFKGLTVISMSSLTPTAVAVVTMLAATAFAQTAKEVRGPSPYAAIENEPPPKLIVDPPLAGALTQGVVWIQYRVENVHIVPVFGTSALNVSPRVGHLHIHVDDIPWWWADASDVNTIDLAGVPPGQHKVRIELVNANHQVFPGCAACSQTVTFTVPESAKMMHEGGSSN